MKTFHLLALVWSCLLLSGCGGMSSGSHPSSAAVAGGPPSDAIRVGDKITVRLTGVPTGEDYINEIQIPESGDITLPDLTRNFHVVGRRPGDLAMEIVSAYKEAKIYTNPNITIIPEERFVNVGGDVRNPMRVIYTTDLTLLSAINSSGGFTEYADKRHVRIMRNGQLTVVNAAAAAKNAVPDPVVYPGDQITVPRALF